jgi:uncharacterized membrane protein YhaH (DUF805 family)
MWDIIFSSYRIVKKPHKAIVNIMPFYGVLETFGLFCTVWIITLIPFGLLYLFLWSLHIPWYVFIAASLLLTVFVIKKFIWNIWGISLFVFDKEGFFVSGNASPIHLHYSDIKTLEIHDVKDASSYRLQFVMHSGETAAINFLCTSHQVLEELAQLIISQSLSKDLKEKAVYTGAFAPIKRFYDNLFSTRLNRKNYIVGMITAWLLYIDIILLIKIFDIGNIHNAILAYTVAIIAIIVVFFEVTLIARRSHDIGFAVNDPSTMEYAQPIMAHAYQYTVFWLIIKLMFIESAGYENQYGKMSDQHVDLRAIFLGA